jgi:hypothetical protein
MTSMSVSARRCAAPSDGEYSLVVAIAHTKRRPGYWKGRLGRST